jgi:TatD DNase family protein
MIDSHCHLDFRQFNGRRDEVVREALAVGVHTIVNIGTDLASSERSVALAERFDAVYATVGVHPHDAKKMDDDVLGRLAELAGHKKVVGIGEIGLDYFRDLSPRDVQREAFRRQLDLASQLALPVVIHTRDSFQPTLAIVREYSGKLPGGVFHCFPGSVNDAKAVFGLGFVISVGGKITYEKSPMAQVAARVPLDRVLLETDAPYLAPEPHRRQTNQPAYVRYVRDKLSELRGIPAAEVEQITDRAAQKLFGLVETFGG